MIVSHDKSGNIDPTVSKIFDYVRIDVPIVIITRSANYIFNDELCGLDKYVLADYCEYDWDYNWGRGTHLFGKNTEDFRDKFPGNEWDRLDQFVKSKPPVLYLKRELLKKDVGGNIVPADYPCYYASAHPIQTKEEFDSRPIDFFHYWGRSHEDRVRVHAETWANSSIHGYSVCDNVYHVNDFLKNESGKKWVSLQIPHYARIELSNLLAVNAHSKLSLALPGAGIKTFRNSEVPINSIMVKWTDDLAWAFPWDETNCILCEPGREIETILNALRNPDLHEICLNGVANLLNYKIDNYTKHIQYLINQYAHGSFRMWGVG